MSARQPVITLVERAITEIGQLSTHYVHVMSAGHMDKMLCHTDVDGDNTR